MVVLGLGANVGDRLSNLRKALAAIRKLPNVTVQQVSPLYLSDALLPDNAPPEWDAPYLNFALRCETSLTPTDLLQQLKNIEWSIGRKPAIRHWGPRILDIDILAWDNLVLASDSLTLPHRNLVERPFALWPFADVAPFWRYPLKDEYEGQTAAQLVEKWGSRFSGSAPFHTRQINQWIEGPQIVGILNVTPDSFSDGGQFHHVEQAYNQAVTLMEDGAEIIDIGAESTSPKALAITPADEWQRLHPVMEAIKAAQKQFLLPPKISIDTRHAEVAAKAIAMGVDWINDVSGLDDEAMIAVVRDAQVDCVCMHHLRIPERRDHVLPRDCDPSQAVYAWALDRLALLENKGIARERIIFDPGIGFGKMAEQSLAVLKQIHIFKQLKTKILVGHSRKTFLSLMSNLPFAERDIETTAISIFLAKANVDYLRVHNANQCARALKVMHLIEVDPVMDTLQQPYEKTQTQ